MTMYETDYCDDHYDHGDHELDDVPTEPGPDDYTLTPSGPCGGRISVAAGRRHLGEYVEDEDALAAVRQDMERAKYWPSVWWISDHGNAWTIDPLTGAATD